MTGVSAGQPRPETKMQTGRLTPRQADGCRDAASLEQGKMSLTIYLSGELFVGRRSGRNGHLVQGECNRRGLAAVSLVASGGDIDVTAQASLE
jgi:hypothetical protein